MARFLSLEELLIIGKEDLGCQATGTAESQVSVLLDHRVDYLIRRHSHLFDVVIVASTPLSHSGVTLNSDDNMIRFWTLGAGRLPTPSETQIESLMWTFYHLLVYDVHSKQQSLFLHPWLFAPEYTRSTSAPPICFDIKEGAYRQVQAEVRAIPDATKKIDGVHALHTTSVLAYRQAELSDLWELVRKRCGTLTMQQDLEMRLQEQTNLSHDVICSWLERIIGIRSEARATALFACPISTLTLDTSTDLTTVPSGVAGMAWITLVTRDYGAGSRPWVSTTQESADSLVRGIWLYLLSDQAVRRGRAQYSLGSQRAIEAATHEMKHVATGLRRWIAASSVLFRSQQVPRDALSIANTEAGFLQIADDSRVKLDDIALVVFPSLFREGLGYIVNWAMSDAPVDLPFFSDDMPTSLEDLAHKCWESAFNSLLFAKVYQMAWDLLAVGATQVAIDNIRALFPKRPVEVVCHGPVSPLEWDTGKYRESARRNTWFARLLIHLFREAIQHGDWQSPVQIAWSAEPDGTEVLRMTNKLGDPVAKRRTLDSTLADLARIRFSIVALADEFLRAHSSLEDRKRNRIRGAGVLEFIASQFGDYSIHGSQEGTDPFWRQLTISRVAE